MFKLIKQGSSHLSSGYCLVNSFIALFIVFLLPVSANAQLPVGSLAHDGPATPEQLSLIVPVTGALPASATASVRYRRSGTADWTTGHPLFALGLT